MLDRLYGNGYDTVTFAQWMMFATPIVLLMVPIVWLVVTYISPKVKLSNFDFAGGGKTVLNEELAKLGKPSSAEKKVFGMFLFAAVLWMFRKSINTGLFVIPGWSQLFEDASLISDATVAVLIGFAMFLIPADLKKFSFKNASKENFLLDWQTARESIPWGVLLLFGGGFALADGFASTGLSLYVGSFFQILGDANIILIIAVICIMLTFLTEVTSNTATTTLILPVLAVAAVSMEQHPYLLMIPATLSASCAFMLPVATPPNAIVCGSKWVTIPKMAKTGIGLNLIGVVLITAVTLMLTTLVLGISIGELPSWATNIN